ncbi:MAG: SDR family oxidoreductase [Methylophilaceae bacterium]
MNILVTGASGFVGKVLCDTLCENGHHVVGVYRNANKINPNLQPFIISDFNADTDWKEALIGVDVIVHLAARVHVMIDAATNPLAEFRKVNVDGTVNLAKQAVGLGVKRFVFISSVKVNGEFTESNKPFTELDIPKPQDDYGISKFEAEQALIKISQTTTMEVTIIRPPLVYGKGVRANFANMIRFIMCGIPLPLGNIHNKRSLVHVSNLVSMILCCIKHPDAANQTFLVSDGEDVSTTELLQSCAKAIGVKARLLPIPQKMLEFGATLLGKKNVAQRLCGNLQVSIDKARRILGWKPIVSFSDGIIDTVPTMIKGK